MNDYARAWILALLAATIVIWAGAFVAIKALLPELDPLSLTLTRFGLASLGFLGVVAWRTVRGHRSLVPDRRLWLPLVLVGFLGTVGYHVSLNVGETYTAAGIASLIVALSPALTAIIAAVLGTERVRPVAVLGIMLAFAGVAIVSVLGRPGAELSLKSLVGPAIVLIAPTAWALNTTVVKGVVARMDAIDMTAISTWIGTVMLVPVTPRGYLHELAALSAGGWGRVVFLAFAATVFGYLAWNLALTRYKATTVASTVYLIPPLTVLMGWLFLSEPVTLWLVVGTAAIIGGVALVDRARTASKATDAEARAVEH